MDSAMDPQRSTIIPAPALYEPSPHFSDAVNRNIIQSEIEGGLYINHLPNGTTLSVQTMNRVYTLVLLGDGAALISGHPEFCPEPV